MKGFVPTPDATVDLMVEKLFKSHYPSESDVVLDPGSGTGAFIKGVLRYCRKRGIQPPRIVGVESDPSHLPLLQEIAKKNPSVVIRHKDFLGPTVGKFKFIIGNPPYVPITKLTGEEKRYYRGFFKTAYQRFDLYMLFFERSLNSLLPGGRLVLITPEKYLYVHSASPLRRMMDDFQVEGIDLMEENTFGDLITYPTITTVVNSPLRDDTLVRLRDGSIGAVSLPHRGESWFPIIMNGRNDQVGPTLADVCTRISCGVATGADAIFVRHLKDLDRSLIPFTKPTIAGREIDASNGEVNPCHGMLIPYDSTGALLPEDELGALGEYLARDENRQRLLERTCVARKPWYAFHENPPLLDIKNPKILCKDITRSPMFVTDHDGDLVPRHTVYYIIPKDPLKIEELAAYLNSNEARQWLMAHCQRAANGFIRMQSGVIKRLPVPKHLLPDPSTNTLTS